LHIAAFNGSTSVVRQLLASNAIASALDSRLCPHSVMVMVMVIVMMDGDDNEDDHDDNNFC
jgi:hypothetical protein